MAGLLDFEDPQVQMGLSLLAAGSPRADGAGFGQRLFEGVQNATAMRRATAQEKMVELQMQAAQRKADMLNDLMQKVKDAQNPAYQALQTGAAAGSVGPTVANAERMNSGATGGTNGMFGNVPLNAIAFDVSTNDGKNIGEWMYKQGTPQIEFINGVAVDKNKVQPGTSIPTLSQDGKAAQIIADPKAPGGYRVIAPQGAVETYSGYANAGEKSKADSDIIEVPDGTGGTVRMTRSDAIKTLQKTLPQSPAPAPVVATTVAPTVTQSPTGAASTPAQQAGIDDIKEQIRQKQTMLKDVTPGSVTAQRLQDDIDAAQRELLRYQTKKVAPTAQFGRTLSKAEEAKLVDTAKADVVRDSTNIQDAKRFGQMKEGIGRAIDLLKQNPTHSGVGALVDSAMGAFGKSNEGADVAAQLETLSGWLTSNVPRMEGPQSDRDVMNYRVQAGMVGDKTKPISQRLKAAEEVMSLQNKYAELNGYGTPKESTQEASPKSWGDYGYKSPDAAIKDAQNAILRNPGAKPEVLRRLKAMGLSLPSGATGGF